jgi:hypothetical protein
MTGGNVAIVKKVGGNGINNPAGSSSHGIKLIVIDAGMVLHSSSIGPQLQSGSSVNRHSSSDEPREPPVTRSKVTLQPSSSHGMQSLMNLCSIIAVIGSIVQFPPKLLSASPQ